jgi:hypothetical protein
LGGIAAGPCWLLSPALVPGATGTGLLPPDCAWALPAKEKKKENTMTVACKIVFITELFYTDQNFDATGTRTGEILQRLADYLANPDLIHVGLHGHPG